MQTYNNIVSRGLFLSLFFCCLAASKAAVTTDRAQSSTKSPFNAWSAPLPAVARDAGLWQTFVEALIAHKMYYGALAAAHRMLNLFNEQAVDQKAYEAIVQLIDLGYPYSTLDYFASGELDLQDDSEFASSYYLYKGMAALDQGMKKWAEYYLGLVNRKTSEKYLFFRAINAYRKYDYANAEINLSKILDFKPTATRFSLMKKAARTLARIYFEKGNFAKSYEIYESFLLRLNPIEPNDWLENAWNLYYLKKYDLALGMLSNLESKAGGKMANLEKYELRALIYQGLCQNKYSERLYASFENEFGSAIHAIKIGRMLTKIPKLSHVYVPNNAPYYELLASLSNLRDEQKSISSLPTADRELAKYLYHTEILMLEKKYPVYAQDAAEAAADQLITYSEKLRFIKFGTARDTLSLDDEKSEAKPQSNEEVVKPIEDFSIRWQQKGDYWRDERSHYRAAIENRCAN